MTYDQSELHDIKQMELSSEDKRKEVGKKLIETVHSGEKTECVQSSGILLKNNMSYYIYSNREKIYERLTESDSYSIKYSLIQLVRFAYRTHEKDELLSDMISNIFNVEEDMMEEDRGYATTYERVYEIDGRDLQDICEEVFGEGFELKRGEDEDLESERRIELKESEKGGVIKKEEDYVEFEVYERVTSKSIDQSRKDIDDFYNAVEACYDIMKRTKRDYPDALNEELEDALDDIIQITKDQVGKYGQMNLRFLSKISTELERDKEEEIVDIFISRLQDEFQNQPNRMFLYYIITSKGEVPREEDIKDALKKEYDIPESSKGALTYESDSETKKAYRCLALIEGIASWKITMIKLGFTQFFFY